MSKFFFGTAGWSYPDWEGIAYPRKKGRAFDRLSYLADYLDMVEVNSSFYHPPTAAISRGWLNKTKHQPDFFFVAKLWQKFTHQRTQIEQRDHDIFCQGLDPLRQAGKWGGLLVQFPWSFDAREAHRDYALELMYRYKTWQPFFEFRHGDWDCPSVRKDLSGLGSAIVNLDQPVYDRAYPLTAEVTAQAAYLRLHGRNRQNWFDSKVGRDGRYDYLYREDELDVLTKTITRLKRRAKKVIAVGNNHFRGQALCNILQLKARVTGKAVIAPVPLRQHFPALKDCSQPPAEGQFVQQSLF